MEQRIGGSIPGATAVHGDAFVDGDNDSDSSSTQHTHGVGGGGYLQGSVYFSNLENGKT